MSYEFEQLGIDPYLMQAVREAGFQRPTAVQYEVIPHLLAGRDLLATAKTGSGKTAAFILPLIQSMVQHPIPKRAKPWVRLLVLTPTRELASQIHQSFRPFARSTRLKSVELIGGVSDNPQIASLEHGVDAVIATPGRLVDLLERRELDLRDVEYFVLDEADMMLDMGFLPDVEQIVSSLPATRKSLLFSATMPDEAVKLSKRVLSNPVVIDLAPRGTVVETVKHRAMLVEENAKLATLCAWIETEVRQQTIVFCRTKQTVSRVSKHLMNAGHRIVAMHGDKSQRARQAGLEAFRNSEAQVLVASDLASRGIDVEGVERVVNFDTPDQADTYVHRVGRTGRAGHHGLADTLVTPRQLEMFQTIAGQLNLTVQWLDAFSPTADPAVGD